MNHAAKLKSLADGSQVLAAAEVQSPATGTMPQSRREARERASEIRENLTPKLSDRISDAEKAEQEKSSERREERLSGFC